MLPAVTIKGEVCSSWQPTAVSATIVDRSAIELVTRSAISFESFFRSCILLASGRLARMFASCLDFLGKGLQVGTSGPLHVRLWSRVSCLAFLRKAL